MAENRDIVITGLGVASPIGIGVETFWRNLVAGTSGTRLHKPCGAEGFPPCLAAEVSDFNPLEYVKPRKSLKVMARDSQLALTAAGLAREHAGAGPESFDPERVATVFGADTINPTLPDSAQTYTPCIVDGEFVYDRWGVEGMGGAFPLNMLKLLPNMLTCHVSIAQDARGPCNTIYQGEASGLLAMAEGASLIERGMADVALVGGASARTQPLDWLRHELTLELSHRFDDPASACRPFDLTRDGQVRGEGSGCLVLEERKTAQARGARPWARLLGWGSACDTPQQAGESGLVRAIRAALKRAGIEPRDLGHVNAHGLGTRADDRREARDLARIVSDLPVLAPKSYFGNLFSASGAVETIASVLALAHNTVPATLNYRQHDPDCPVRVLREPLSGAKPLALVVNFTSLGQAVAVVLGAS